MLILCRNTLLDIPRIMLNQISGYSDPVKLTQKVNHHCGSYINKVVSTHCHSSIYKIKEASVNCYCPNFMLIHLTVSFARSSLPWYKKFCLITFFGGGEQSMREEPNHKSGIILEYFPLWPHSSGFMIFFL